MKAIIPAAGIGSRLRPHTHTLPKALLHVAGKPIIGHILDHLVELDVQEAVIVIGAFGDKTKDYVKKNYQLKATFVEQKKRQGLGHSLYLAMQATKPEPVLIVYGDTIFEGDIAGGIDFSVDGSLGVKEVDDPRRFGTVEVEGGRIVRLVEKPEKPRSNLVIIGVNFINNFQLLQSCLTKIVEEDIKTRGEYQLTDAFQLMIDEGAHLTAFSMKGWFDCGKPETILATIDICSASFNTGVRLKVRLSQLPLSSLPAHRCTTPSWDPTSLWRMGLSSGTPSSRTPSSDSEPR